MLSVYPMNLREIVTIGMFSMLSLGIFGQENGRFPKSDEIEKYVKKEYGNVISEFNIFTNDSIEEFYYNTFQFSKYYDDESPELGFYDLLTREATINSDEKYLALEKSDFKNLEDALSSNAFVKGVMIHELSHAYITELIFRLKDDGVKINSNYNMSRGIPIYKDSYGAEFIEEGLCEYIAKKMDEIVVSNNLDTLILKELEKNKESYKVKYLYSENFLEDFLDEYGIKNGIRIIVTNSPPTDEEIIYPEKYFSRLRDTRPINLKLRKMRLQIN